MGVGYTLATMSERKTTKVLNIRELVAQATAKAKEPIPCFIVISGKSAGRLYKLASELAVIGRGADATIYIDDDSISRFHAQVRKTASGIVVEDLDSTNGTFFNGDKKAAHVLQDGDKIQIGSTTILKFSHADGLEEEFHRNLYESATRDPLTSAYNKKFFVERLSSELTYAVRHKTELSLAMLDLDHFKKVNDIHGHAGGDAILKHFVALVHGLIRGEDVLGRCGGDEFAIIFRETPAQEALNVAERIRKRLEGSVCEHQGRPIPVTCSIGVCTTRGANPSSAGDLLKATDALLYQAKQAGRNRAISGWSHADAG